MAATALPKQFQPSKSSKRKFKLKEKSSHFELSGVGRMIGYIMMLAKMQLSAIV